MIIDKYTMQKEKFHNTVNKSLPLCRLMFQTHVPQLLIQLCLGNGNVGRSKGNLSLYLVLSIYLTNTINRILFFTTKNKTNEHIPVPVPAFPASNDLFKMHDLDDART